MMTIDKNKIELPTWLISILIPLLFAGIFYIISGISELKADNNTLKIQVNRIEIKLDNHIISSK